MLAWYNICAVIVRLSVRPSVCVCVCVTLWYCIKTAKHITQIAPHCSSAAQGL